MKRSSVLVRQCLVCFIPRPPHPRPARAVRVPQRAQGAGGRGGGDEAITAEHVEVCTVSRRVHLAPVEVVDRVNHAQQVLGLGNPPVLRERRARRGGRHHDAPGREPVRDALFPAVQGEPQCT